MIAGQDCGNSGRERAAVVTLLGLAVVLKIAATFRYRVNSDEPQHLHVVWGWVQGLLPYRDFFDNHPPLFHVLMVPAFLVAGERADAVAVMRLAMLPLYAAALALTYRLGTKVGSPRAGLVAGVVLGVHYDFLLRSTEFRTDNLWTVLWLAALVVMVGGPATVGRTLAWSVVLGAALCVSQKTVLLVCALLIAAALTLALSGSRPRAGRWARTAVMGTAAVGGFTAVPLAVSGFFAARRALGALVSCTVAHNALPGLGAWQHPWRLAILPAGLAVTAILAAPGLRAPSGDGPRVVRIFLVLVGVSYLLLLEGVWPLVTGQDFLPLLPLAAIVVGQGFAAWHVRRSTRPGWGGLPAAVLGTIVLAELAVVVGKGPIWRDRTTDEVELVADVLRLTDAGQAVMDTKGEALFRPRPFYPVLETISIARLRRGLMADTIPEDLVRSRCYVAVNDSDRFPTRGRGFLNENYLAVGRLRVAGRMLDSRGGGAGELPFEIAIPGPYAIVGAHGAANGTLDGTRYDGPRMLGGGRHAFAPAGAEHELAAVWAQAISRGFTPFAAAGGGR